MEKKPGHAHADGYDRRACNGRDRDDRRSYVDSGRGSFRYGGISDNLFYRNSVYYCIRLRFIGALHLGAAATTLRYAIMIAVGFGIIATIAIYGTGGTGRLPAVGHYLCHCI